MINTRNDLDAAQGTPAHSAFMNMLAGSIYRLEKDDVNKTWKVVEDTSTIERFGFNRGDFTVATPDLPVYPSPTLSERKQSLIAILEAEYEAAAHEPIAYLNTTFQADKQSQDLITDVLVAAGFTMPLGFMWRDSNNVAVNVEGNLLHGLAQAILMRAQPLFWAKSAKKDVINACLTGADLDLYLDHSV